MAQDMRALRAFVMAKDGHEYENLPDGMVCLHITHSNLKMEMVDIRLDLHSTIADVRHKVYRHSGTKPDAMELLLLGPDNSVLARLDDDRKMLGYYSVHSGMRLHVVDRDPFSLSKGGGLEDVSLVQKYEISEADYDKREKTVRAYKKDQLAKDPNWKPKPMMNQRPAASSAAAAANAAASGPESVTHIAVHDRCEVQPGSRRGRVAFVGKVPELAPGYWVGVVFDEPLGKSTGVVKGTTYFTCDAKFGGFIRPQNVAVGAFPVEDLFGDDDDSDDDEL